MRPLDPARRAPSERSRFAKAARAPSRSCGNAWRAITAWYTKCGPVGSVNQGRAMADELVPTIVLRQLARRYPKFWKHIDAIREEQAPKLRWSAWCFLP